MRNRAGNFSVGRLIEFLHRARSGREDYTSYARKLVTA